MILLSCSDIQTDRLDPSPTGLGGKVVSKQPRFRHKTTLPTKFLRTNERTNGTGGEWFFTRSGARKKFIDHRKTKHLSTLFFVPSFKRRLEFSERGEFLSDHFSQRHLERDRKNQLTLKDTPSTNCFNAHLFFALVKSFLFSNGQTDTYSFARYLFAAWRSFL